MLASGWCEVGWFGWFGCLVGLVGWCHVKLRRVPMYSMWFRGLQQTMVSVVSFLLAMVHNISINDNAVYLASCIQFWFNRFSK